jgi:hypothetical protein
MRCRSLDSRRSLGMTMRCRSLDSRRSLGMTAPPTSVVDVLRMAI